MAKVRSILKQGLKNFGQAGDVVFLKRGYLRYLQTIDRAQPATKSALQALENTQQELREKDSIQRAQAQTMAETLRDHKVILQRPASVKGSLYGKLGAREIAKALQEQGLDVSAEQISLQTPIKEVGVYKVGLTYHSDITITIQIEVVSQQEKDA